MRDAVLVLMLATGTVWAQTDVSQHVTAGAGEHAIADAFAAGASTVVAEPGYAYVEQFGNIAQNTGHYSQARPESHFEDRRHGGVYDSFYNPGANAFNGEYDGPLTVCNASTLPRFKGGLGYLTQRSNCTETMMWSSTPGFNAGVARLGPGGWNVTSGARWQMRLNTMGIANGLELRLAKFGTGDVNAITTTAISKGGQVEGAGEGVVGIQDTVLENEHVYTGTVVSGGAHATRLRLQCEGGLCEEIGPGHPFIDKTSGVLSGSVTKSTPTGQSFVTLVTDFAVEKSSAAGTLVEKVETPLAAEAGTGRTEKKIVVRVGMGAFEAGRLVCFTGQYLEQARIKSVDEVKEGRQEIVLPLRHAFEAGTMVYQEGACGKYLEFKAKTFDDRRYLANVVGSGDEHTLVATTIKQGNLAVGAIAGLTGAVTLYDGAEVLDANDDAVSPAKADGLAVALDENNGQWKSGDAVENPDSLAATFHGLKMIERVHNPYALYLSAMTFHLQGRGINSMDIFDVHNDNPEEYYGTGQNAARPPVGVHYRGPFGAAIAMDHPPERYLLNSNLQQPTLLYVGPFAKGSTQTEYNIFTSNTGSFLKFTPGTQQFSWHSGAAMTIDNGLTVERGLWSKGVTTMGSSGQATVDANGNISTSGRVASQQGTPKSATDTCTAGQMWTDANYIYVCVAANTIKRAALTSF